MHLWLFWIVMHHYCFFLTITNKRILFDLHHTNAYKQPRLKYLRYTSNATKFIILLWTKRLCEIFPLTFSQPSKKQVMHLNHAKQMKVKHPSCLTRINQVHETWVVNFEHVRCRPDPSHLFLPSREWASAVCRRCATEQLLIALIRFIIPARRLW